MDMEISNEGLELIKEAEGLRLKAYKCPAGVWTIGYGHTGGVRAGQTITLAKAEELLRCDVEWAERAVNDTRVPLRQTQFDALVSLVFNIGAGAFAKSSLRRKLVAGAADKVVASEFLKWKYSRGQILPALLKRRQKEAALFMR